MTTKMTCVWLLWLVIGVAVRTAAQEPRLTQLLHPLTLDSGAGKHFAQLYLQFTDRILPETNQLPQDARHFVLQFTENFASLFLQAHERQLAGLPPGFSWERYYDLRKATLLHYQFTGMNAHINGDMWQALRQTGPADSIRKYRRTMIGLKPVFDRFFDSLYTVALQEKRVKKLHRLSAGLTRWYGKSMIARWRKRQVNLAYWYDIRPRRFQRKWGSVRRKMVRLDSLAAKWLR